MIIILLVIISTVLAMGLFFQSGAEELEFIEFGKAKCDPKEIILGVHEEGGYFEVISGLRSGYEDDTSGRFMLDSERSLRESVL